MLQRLHIAASTILVVLCVFGAMLFSAGGKSWAGCDYLNWKHYPYAIPGTEVTIPNDDGRHTQYMGEWWYASLHLTSTVGHHYGAFVAFFKTPFIRELKVFSISDLDQDQNFTYSTVWGLLSAATGKLDLTYTEELFSPDRWYNKKYLLQLLPFQYKLVVDGEAREDGSAMLLDLNMESMKAPMKVGDSAKIYIGNSMSYYYSHTRVAVSGQIQVDGRAETVTGTAWIDHQYGDVDTSQYVSWEWFAITLNDSREIMVSDAWLEGYYQGSHSAGLNFYDENCVHHLLPNYTLTTIDSALWVDPVTGLLFGTQWRIQEPSRNINLLITADYKNQVMRMDPDPIIPLPEAFWEGACTVTGTIDGAPVSGKAYAELTHPRGWPLYGNLTDDTLPTRYGPYVVTADVVIPAGHTVYIQPGVEILFLGDYRFDVYGGLKAMGTASDSVVFTHYEDNPDSTWRGLRFYNASPACTLKYCIIEYGSAHGSGNDGNGGGIYCQNSSPVVSHCTIRNNAAAGIGGGVYFMGSNASFDRCLIVGNDDGGIYFGGTANIILNHCTISDNDQYGIQSPASEFPSWHMTTANTIVYDNDGESVISTSRSFTANYCDIADYYLGGTGNIDCDPRFVNYYHLDSGSCCINAGDPAPANNDPDGTRGDIGVFYRPRSGCPYVSVWNGSAFVRDNNILPQSEESSRNGNVTDYYRLRQAIQSDDGRYRLRIEEFEQEYTQADYFRIDIIDHPQQTRVAVTDDGRYFAYSDLVPPVTASGRDGDDLPALLAADDGNTVGGMADRNITLDFGPVTSVNGVRLVAHIDRNCANDAGSASQLFLPAVPQTPVPQKPTVGIERADNNKRLPGLAQLGENASTSTPLIRTRENGVIALADVTSILPANGERFVISLTVPAGYDLDFVGLDCSDPTPVDVRSVGVSSAVHSHFGDVTDNLVSAEGDCVEISPEQYLDLAFEADAPRAGLTRDVVLVSTGRYNRFQPSLHAGNSDQGDAVEISNYPNPFNLSTTINFRLQDAAAVKLDVFNVVGQRVVRLVDGNYDAGEHAVAWDGITDTGQPAASGVYFYRIKANDHIVVKKMVMMK